ncbi:MAG: MATE family efflux transporter [Candidatus Omnitrophica bacterium]|nr:MATE family efflux transporter [Candidatus Omnitrophota bacterium]MDD5436170.1 MATE family efflux transporter [Candidatus Omnitrophota bacterium]
MEKIRSMLWNDNVKALVSESWAVSWPMTLIMLFEFFIGITDIYVAGKFGKEAQAAYGIAFQLYFVFIIIGIALSVGLVSVVSRLFTSGRREEFTAAVNSSLLLAIMSGLLFSAAGVLFARQVIGMLNMPEGVKYYAAPFLLIYSIGFVFDYALMAANGILRASNSIKASFLIMAIVCVMNVALDFALSFGTPLGFKGIAVATVISLATGSFLALIRVRKLIGKVFKLSAAVIKNILNISWPSGLQQVLWQISAIILYTILGMLPAHNVEILAAFTNGLKIESAIFLPAFAFHMANEVVVGNLLGKKDNANAFRGGIITAVVGVSIVFVITILIMLNARQIAATLSDNGIVVGESVRYIYIALLCEPVMAWGVVLGGGLNGAGDTRGVMTIFALAVWLVRLPLSYLLGIYYGMGAVAIWWAMNLSILIQTVFITKRYFARKWFDLAAG